MLAVEATYDIPKLISLKVECCIVAISQFAASHKDVTFKLGTNVHAFDDVL